MNNTYKFSCKDEKLTVSYNNTTENIITINNIETELLKGRFISDIIKDAKVKEAVITDINTILTKCFKNYTNITEGIEKLKNHLIEIDILKNKKETNTAPNEIVYKNLLKVSTMGIMETRISDAKYIFRDSGLRIDKICSKPEQNIITPGSIMDPAPKGADKKTIFFPEPKTTIHFDSKFTNQLGFPPDLEWKCTTIHKLDKTPNKTVKYDITIKYDEKETIDGYIYYPPKKLDKRFEELFIGNEIKNEHINSLYKNNNSYVKIKNILLSKELGDIAQIWLYLAYVVMKDINITVDPNTKEKNDIEKRKSSLMITGDDSVYLFCVLLNLSAVHTGGRTGIESGECLLRHFLVGEVDYNLRLKNKIYVECFDPIINNNTSIRNALIKIKLESYKNIEFYYKDENRKIKRFLGNHIVEKLKELYVNINNDIINVIITKEISNINKNNIALMIIKHKFDNFIPNNTITSDNINVIYTEYSTQINTHKHPQIITQKNEYLVKDDPEEKKRNYLLQPETEFLKNFAALLHIETLATFDDLRTGITDGNIILNNENNVSNQRGGHPDADYSDNSYYECLILCFIYETYFLKKIEDSIKFEQEDHAIIFAILYDHYVSLINNTTDINTILPGIIDFNNTKFEEDIISIGNKLSEYIYFSTEYLLLTENELTPKKELKRHYQETERSKDDSDIPNKVPKQSVDTRFRKYPINNWVSNNNWVTAANGGNRRKTKKRRSKKRITRKNKRN